MSQQGNSIEIIDKYGWRKQYPLPQKPIIHLGSAAGNDIVLLDEHGGGVSGVHAQIIAPTTHHAGYQLVNLSESTIALGQSGGGALPPRGSVDVGEGSTFQLGDFTIVFHGEGGFYGGPTLGSSRNIGVRVVLSHTTLAPDEAIEGSVTIRNIGERTGVQFEVTLEGLTTDCFDLEPGPLLSSGAEKNVALRIFHRGALPAAGNNQISIRVVAPSSYPGERVVVSQMIEVLPMFRHKLGLVIGKSGSLPQLDETEKLTPKEAVKTGRRPTPATTPSVGVDDWWAAPAGAVAASAAATQPAQVYRAAAPQTAGTWAAPADSATTPASSDAVDWFSTPAPASPQPAPPSPHEAEAASWWAAPEADSTPPADTSDAATVAGVAAVAGIAGVAAASRAGDAADWFGAPAEETATTATTPAAPAPQTEAAADWWAAPAQESPAEAAADAPPATPAPATIPQAAHVPRQADDWFAAPPPEPAASSATPPIPTAADVPRQADDWFAAPSEPEPAADETISDWSTESENPPETPPAQVATAQPAGDAGEPHPAAVAGAAALAGLAAGAVAAGTLKKTSEPEPPPAVEPQVTTPAVVAPAAAPPDKTAAAAALPAEASDMAPPTPDEPAGIDDADATLIAAKPPATTEPAAVETSPETSPPDEDDGLWSKTKKWGIGLALALPFVKAAKQPEPGSPAAPPATEPEPQPAAEESTQPQAIATEHPAPPADDAVPPAAGVDPGRTAVFRVMTPSEASEIIAATPTEDAEISGPGTPPVEDAEAGLSAAAPAKLGEPATPTAAPTEMAAAGIGRDAADEATLFAVAPPEPATVEAGPAEVQPVEADDAAVDEPSQSEPAAEDWWDSAWGTSPPAASTAVTAQPEPAPPLAPNSPAEPLPQVEASDDAPDETSGFGNGDDWWPTDAAESQITDTPPVEADDTGGDDWRPLEATGDAPIAAVPAEKVSEPGLSRAEMPVTPAPQAADDDTPPPYEAQQGSHWGTKEAWQPLVPGAPQLAPEDWWHDDSDFDVTEDDPEASSG